MPEKVTIGKSDVTTLKLGLGTNKVGGHNLFPDLDDDQGKEIVRKAIDSGIQLLDTAFAYGLGRSEELIGQVVKEYDRSKVVIATKAAQDPKNDYKNNNDPAFLKQAVDDALKRLQTDYIDIFYIHFPDDQTPKDEAVAALADEKKAGKIRAIGVSNFTLDQIKEANKDGLVDIVENNYNLVHRDEEKDVFPYLKENNISFVPFFPLASGLLTGKYKVGDLKNFANAGRFQNFTSEQFDQIVKNLEKVAEIAKRYDATVAQTIIAWYIKNPAISVVIPGAHRPEQVASNAKSLDIDLTDDEFKQIDQLLR